MSSVVCNCQCPSWISKFISDYALQKSRYWENICKIWYFLMDPSQLQTASFISFLHYNYILWYKTVLFLNRNLLFKCLQFSMFYLLNVNSNCGIIFRTVLQYHCVFLPQIELVNLYIKKISQLKHKCVTFSTLITT